MSHEESVDHGPSDASANGLPCVAIGQCVASNNFLCGYRTARRQHLVAQFDEVHADAGLAGRPLTLSAFRRCCDLVHLCCVQDVQVLEALSGDFLADLFALYWTMITRELDEVLDSFCTPDADSVDDGYVDARRSERRRFRMPAGLADRGSSGDVLVTAVDAEEPTSKNADVQVVLSLADQCWQLEVQVLGLLETYLDDGSLFPTAQPMRDRPYSDYMGSEEPVTNSNWRSLFVPFIGEMMNAVDRDLRFTSASKMEQEWDGVLQGRRRLGTVSVAGGDVADGDSLHVLESVASFCDACQAHRRLCVSAGVPLAALRTSFMDGVHRVCSQLLGHVVLISRSVPSQLGPANFYVLLASLLKLKTNLDAICAALDNRQFDHVLGELVQVEEAVVEQVIRYHCDVVATRVLLDAESHDWANSKPFFEDERCSFAVQQWHLHMCALRHDLWTCYPTGRATSIFATVLEDSLRVFVSRYSSAKPSQARTLQLRADIVAILLCVHSFLGFCSSGASPLTATDLKEGHLQRSVDDLCTALVVTSVLLTAPLKIIYKTLKKKNSSLEDPDRQCGKKVAKWCWLILRRNQSDLNCDTALDVALHLKNLCGQPTANWMLLFKFLLATCCAAPKMLLSHPYVETCASSANVDQKLAKGFTAFDCFRSLMFALYPSKGFVQVFLLWMDKNSLNSDFFLEYTPRTHEEPCARSMVDIGTDVLLDVSEPFVDSVIETVAILLVPLTLLTNEPKENATQCPPPVDRRRTVEDVLRQILDILPSNLPLLPDSVCQLILQLNERSNRDKHLNIKHCLPFQFVCILIGVSLCKDHPTSKCSRLMQNSSVCDIISQLSESFLFIGRHSTNSKSHLDALSSNINNAMFSVQEHFRLRRRPVEDSHAMSATTVLMDLMHCSDNAKVLQSLKCVQWLVLGSKDWFLRNLGIDQSGSSGCKDINAEIISGVNISAAASKDDRFNPFDYFDRIGDTGCSFKQSSLLDVPVDWQRLTEDALSGRPAAAFLGSLLSHRWEFQSDVAALQEPDQKYVALLRDLYLT